MLNRGISMLGERFVYFSRYLFGASVFDGLMIFIIFSINHSYFVNTLFESRAYAWEPTLNNFSDRPFETLSSLYQF